MSIFLYLENNLFGIILLVIMYISNRKTYSMRSSYDTALFNGLLFTTILVLIFDAGMWYLDGKTFAHARTLNIIVTTLYFILNPAPCIAWLCYGDYKLNSDQAGLLKRLPLYSIPGTVNAILVLISLKTTFMFSIDAQNIYQREPGVWITLAIAFFYLVLSSVLVLLKAKESFRDIPKEIYIYFFMFPLLPIIGAILQMLFYGLSLIWMSVVISIFLIFINIQSKSLYLDSLTGVYNRKYMKYHWRNLQRLATDSKTGFLLIIDVDDFKQINDNYGHIAGDLTLQKLAKLLADVCRNDHTIFRYGGDEFIITGVNNAKEPLSSLTAKIQEAVTKYNQESELPYSLSISIGTSIFDSSSVLSFDDLIRDADIIMYHEKQSKKSNDGKTL